MTLTIKAALTGPSYLPGFGFWRIEATRNGTPIFPPRTISARTLADAELAARALTHLPTQPNAPEQTA